MVDNSGRAHAGEPPIELSGGRIRDPGLAPYRHWRSRGTETDNGPDGAAPLFLSDQYDDEYYSYERRRRSAFTPSRILGGIFIASVVAMGVTIFYVDGARDGVRDIVANARAALSKATTPVMMANTVQPPRPEARAANSDLPSRAQIAAAYQQAVQTQVVPREPSEPAAAVSDAAPPAQAAAAPPARTIDAEELVALMNRAKGLLAVGDITAARLLLERAADGREAEAALLLAKTYDPEVLGTQDARAISPDPEQARVWYRKAAELGSQHAQQRLAQMRN